MTDAKILRGWGQIEMFTGLGRTTLLRKKYPIQKEGGGCVWADTQKLDEHRVTISAQKRPKVIISAH